MESLCHLGTNNLARLAMLLVDGDKPVRKKIKTYCIGFLLQVSDKVTIYIDP